MKDGSSGPRFPRSFWWLVGGQWLAIFGLLVVVLAGSRPKTLTALQLGSDDGPRWQFGVVEGTARLSAIGSDGEEHIRLSVGKNGNPELRIGVGPSIVLATQEGPPRVVLRDRDGKVGAYVMLTDEGSALGLFQGDEQTGVLLGASEHEGGSGVWCYNDGSTAMSISSKPSGAKVRVSAGGLRGITEGSSINLEIAQPVDLNDWSPASVSIDRRDASGAITWITK